MKIFQLYYCQKVLSASILVIGLTVVLLPVNAKAALVTRFVMDVPASASSASRFPLSVELYDTSAGARVTASGVTVTLSLFRCPGFPLPCSVVLINSNFASAVTTAGVATFAGQFINTAATDYYFAGLASGYSSGTSQVFDVDQARMRLEVAPTTTISTASRFPVQAVLRRGTGASDPIDVLADGISVRLALLRCPGFPSSCSVNVVNSNFANLTMNDGIVTFNNLFIDVANDAYYFVPTTPSASGINFDTSSVFDVAQATMRVESPLSTFLTNQFYPLDVVIRRGTLGSDPIDILANSMNVRLRLFTCPGFPSACAPSELNSNFSNATAVNGIASFNNLIFTTAGNFRYFVPTVTTTSGINGLPSSVFDVLLNPQLFSNGFENP